MIRVHRVLIAVLLFGTSLARAQLHPNDLVAICGDSITEQKQYSVFIETYLIACNSVPGVRTMQFGWGGETSWGFASRLDNDVLRYKPNVVTTCYGMNDGGYSPMTEEKAEKYRSHLEKIANMVQASGVRFVVIGSSGCVDVQTFRKKPEEAAMYNTTLAAMRDIARGVAEKEETGFADVFGPMLDVMSKSEAKYGAAYHIAGADGVHPARNGHLVMAYAFLKALGCDGNIGTIMVDLAKGQAETTKGHQVTSMGAGPTGSLIEIESTRYPFCFSGDPASVDATSGVIEFFPFNDDLNRLMLKVSNATHPKLKVSWGNASKTFTKDELEKGINLASEFIDNPFSEAFAAVEKAVRAQQNFETPMIKRLITVMPVYADMLPEQKALLDQLAGAALEKQRALSDAARATVKPVKHTIRIEKAE